MPTSPKQLLEKFTTAYKEKSTLYNRLALNKPAGVLSVEKFLQTLIDDNEELPEYTASDITKLMHNKLIKNQQDCLDKKATGVSLANGIFSLVNLMTAKEILEKAYSHKRYELSVLAIYFYCDLFHHSYTKASTPVTLKDQPSFCAWEAAIEELELVAPPNKSTEVVEWLYQLKTYFNITPPREAYTSRAVLFAIKEQSSLLMISNSAELNKTTFNNIVEKAVSKRNIPHNDSLRATQAVAVIDKFTGEAVSFHKKIMTAQEVLDAAMGAYYKNLSYQATYVSQLPASIVNLRNYLQHYIDKKQALPSNAIFDITQIMGASLYSCTLRVLNEEKKPRISEKGFLGILGSAYLIFLLYMALINNREESQLGFFIQLTVVIVFINIISLGLLKEELDSLAFNDFGEFRAWAAVIQVAQDYQPVDSRSQSIAKEIAAWLARLKYRNQPLPTEKSFSSLAKLYAVQKSSNRLSDPLYFYRVELTQENFNTIENHATAYTHDALDFMHQAGVLTQESFDLLFQEKYSVLMSKEISEELWRKLPSHLKNPAVWQGILAQCESDEPKTALIAYAEQLLRGNPEQVLNALLNHAQSTHEKSVELSIGRSALALLARYRKALEAEKSSISDYLVDLLQETKPKKPSLIDVIRTWVNALPEPEDQHPPKNKHAKLGFRRIFQYDFAAYQEPRSKLPTLDLLKLVWLALHDKDNITCSIDTALDRLRDAFYEIEVEYTLDADGKKKNPNAQQKHNMDTCVSGAFNKIAEVLWGIHKDMQVLYITKEGAAKKLFALVKQVENKTYTLFNTGNVTTNNLDGLDIEENAQDSQANTYSDPEPFIKLAQFLQPIHKKKLDTAMVHIDSSYPDENHSIIDAVFEEYRFAFNNRQNPEFLAICKEAEKYLSGILEQAQEDTFSSSIYQQFCSRQLQVSGLFAKRLENGHIKSTYHDMRSSIKL